MRLAPMSDNYWPENIPGKMTLWKCSFQPFLLTCVARAELPMAGVPKVMHETGGVG